MQKSQWQQDCLLLSLIIDSNYATLHSLLWCTSVQLDSREMWRTWFMSGRGGELLEREREAITVPVWSFGKWRYKCLEGK